MKYPVRCRIVDVTGGIMGGYELKTPEKSKPHIDKLGTAYDIGDNVRIEMDDGSILYGYECWWEPVNDEAI